MVVPLPSHCGDPLRRISLLLPTLFFSTSTSTSSSTLNLLAPPPKPCPGEFPLVLFYRSLLRLLTCSIFHFLLCPFVRVFSLPLSPSPFSALLISALSTVCLSSFRMFESCLFFWLLIISACTVFLLISFSRLHAVFFSFFSRPISLLSIRVLPSLWSRDPVLSLLWLLFYKTVLLSSLVFFFFLLLFSYFLLNHTPF